MQIKNKIKDLLNKFYAKIFLKRSNKVEQEIYSQSNQIHNSISKYLLSSYEHLENQEEYEMEKDFEIPDTSVKPIAFYLPQFYPFEENNKFWGKGFTEWHNVTRALPLYQGHYQPKLAGELGYYDLRLKEIIKRQIELAVKHGIYGFCFHHYFFNQKPVMREPLNLFLDNKDLNIPFCLHWANEPWTVRWDGVKEKGGVLLNQTHSDDENMEFIKDAMSAFRDKRYIKVEEKPVLLIYRPALFSDFKRTVDIWTKYCLDQGLNGIYLVMVQSTFDKTKDPNKYGCDAAVEFPPHRSFRVSKKLKVPLYIKNFKGNIIDYHKLAAYSINRKKPAYTLFRGIMPAWDNTARIRNADIYHGASPSSYKDWLIKLANYTRKNHPDDRQFIFINAWNEWAEGAYLEPDRKYGYAYLNATANALIESEKIISKYIEE